MHFTLQGCQARRPSLALNSQRTHYIPPFQVNTVRALFGRPLGGGTWYVEGFCYGECYLLLKCFRYA